LVGLRLPSLPVFSFPTFASDAFAAALPGFRLLALPAFISCTSSTFVSPANCPPSSGLTYYSSAVWLASRLLLLPILISHLDSTYSQYWSLLATVDAFTGSSPPYY
jgi:hypothetical protein